MNYFVSIPTYVCFDLLDQCIDAVLKSTLLPERIYVIDNSQGAYPGHSSPKVQVFTPPRNLGAGGAANFILPAVMPYPCVVLNDDIEVEPDMLEAMVRCPEQVVAGARGSAFTAILIREEAWRKVGPFDPIFWPAYFEDCDWAYRAAVAGFSIVAPPSGGFRNNGPSATKARMTASDRAIVDHYYAKNAAYYHAKWGGGPHCEVFTEPFNGDREKWESTYSSLISDRPSWLQSNLFSNPGGLATAPVAKVSNEPGQ